MKARFDRIRHHPVRVHEQQLEVGYDRLGADDQLALGGSLGSVAVRSLVEAAQQFVELTDGHCTVQLGVLVFAATGNRRALDLYFPILRMLGEPEIVRFDELTEHVAEHPHFDLKLIGLRRADLTSRMPPGIRQVAAGQLAEVFFHRTELLERFLAAPRHFQLYTNAQAFKHDGGTAGGDYSPQRQSIQLVLERLFEGFFGETAGVCPLLHELGHMLDHFDAATVRMGRPKGMLPGLSPSDGSLFNPRARSLFLRGKRLELERYLALSQRTRAAGAVFPIGHPYVFQNDGEFIAGYFEMFFRNPNYFAKQNPDLYASFVELFGYDPRKAWQRDFPFYVQQNREFYLSQERPGRAGLSVPDE